MIDLKLLRNNPEVVAASVKNRGGEIDLDAVANLDAKRREIVFELDQIKQKRNENSGLIGKGKLEADEKQKLVEETRNLGETIKAKNAEVKEIEDKISDIAMGIPNLLHESVPIGPSEDDNVEQYTWGEIPSFDFEVKHHLDVAENLGIMDSVRGVKLAHSRFTLVKQAGAMLERALANFMLDLQIKEHGYTEILPPLLVNTEIITGTGQLPKFEVDLFKTTDGLYLIPTAEVPLTGIYNNEILKEEELPYYFTAFTPCFRSEAGSYGKDTKGYIRQHQFNKVELVKIVHPDKSYEELESLVKQAEEVLKRLELPFRVIALCSGDIGFAAAKCYDIEVWIPSEDKYREISSCSNCTDFQARRSNIRFKPKEGGKTQFVHTLNGSGMAVGRTVVAILENYQNEDGSVTIPKALVPYMGGLTEISNRA
ncbi:MAG: serine--tRNA ligase [Proteobacteria bacterium]|nr:serine--tRNA ligase [Pseudomonadota bacterium]